MDGSESVSCPHFYVVVCGGVTIEISDSSGEGGLHSEVAVGVVPSSHELFNGLIVRESFLLAPLRLGAERVVFGYG